MDTELPDKVVAMEVMDVDRLSMDGVDKDDDDEDEVLVDTVVVF